MPSPVTVTTALRGLVVGFWLAAVTVIEPLPLPDEGDTVNHDWLLETLQLIFEVTSIVPDDPEADPIDIIVGLTKRDGPCPSWVTSTVRVMPSPVTVTTAVRGLVVGFWLAAVTVIEPLLLPLDGDTVNQD